MFYIPTDLLNENNIYYFKDNMIIIKNNNSCIDLYPTLDYIYSNSYTCENLDYSTLNYSKLTDNWWYKINVSHSFIIFIILAIFCIYIPFRIFTRMFGRWLKW